MKGLSEKLGSGICFLGYHIPKESVRLISFWIPKFKISYGYEAPEVLKDLRLVASFTDPNGLTEIAESLNCRSPTLS